MSSSSKGKSDPPVRRSADDELIFPVDAEPTDDTPTIISKTHPTVDPKLTGNPAIDIVGIKAGPDTLGNGLRGRRLAHFELIEPIGVGGMAAVLRARDTQLDRQVALKILPPEMAADQENIRRFHQEARAAARLDHENIARVFFCGEDQGLHFIAFEFVEGENIRTLLERRGRLPVHEAVRYVLQVATGLEHAAARGVVHRDVKPSNIIVSPNGRAKIVDMGLARNMERQDADLTQSGVTLGTFDYISPEQALEPRDADVRSDIYSLGCTFYHMLTGTAPVPEGTAAKKLHHHQHIAPVDPRQLNPEIPDDVAMILSRMMQKDPRARYQRPLQLVQHLMQVARKVGAADDLPEGVLFVDAPLPAGPRSRPLIVIGLPFVALGFVILLLALNPSERDTVPPVVMKDQGVRPAIDKGKDSQPAKTQPTVAKVAPSVADNVVSTAKELAEIIKGPSLRDRRDIKLSGAVNLEEIAGLAIEGGATANQPLTFRSSTSEPATLSFDADARAQRSENQSAVDGLTILGGHVVFENLKIKVKSAQNWSEAVAAIAIRGGATVVFKRCQFEQDVMAYDSVQTGIASVLVASARGETRPTPPQVDFVNCGFAGKDAAHIGQVAVAIDGPGKVRVQDCGFRPHATFFQLRPSCRLADTMLSLNHCSGFVFDGPVFGFQSGAGAKLRDEAANFSRYEEDTKVALSHPPNLIHQPDDTKIEYVGKQNYYHHLNALWETKTLFVNTLAKFKAALKDRESGTDESDRESLLAQRENPWYSEKPLDGRPDSQAFMVKPEFEQYGLQSCYWGKLERAPVGEPSLAAKERLYDPDYKGQSPKISNRLDKALSSLEKGDTLFLKPNKDNDPIEMPPWEFRNPVDATIKAWPDTAPIVRLAQASKNDVAFFTMQQEGKLHFERLHFVAEPRPELAGPLSVLKIGDNVQVSFDHCVFTLKANGNNIISVVSLIDPKERMMPKTTAPANSRVQFVNSFIRGDGDLANFCTCRPVQVGLDNSLVAVAGSLVDLDVKSDEMAAEQGPVIELNRSTVFSRDAAFSLNSTRTGKGLGKIHVDAKNCLFAALSKRPLINLKAPDVQSEGQFGKYLDWRGEQNGYARIERFIEYERPDEMGTQMTVPMEQWIKLFPESQTSKDEIRLPANVSDLVLTQVRPEELRPTNVETSVPGVGSLAEIESLLKASEPR